ncbi:hypothetical protein ABEB36_008979 [Hypothenemus hampei]|uniref:Uncharacterized protein n=1 Tax=Hypothenemus hampei TaxID=57062 RepID=A0ABD1ESQ3_HYPHA
MKNMQTCTLRMALQIAINMKSGGRMDSVILQIMQYPILRYFEKFIVVRLELFKKVNRLAEAHKNRRNLEIDETALNAIENVRGRRTREIGAVLNFSHNIVWRILVDNLLNTYYIHSVQVLFVHDAFVSSNVDIKSLIW